MKLLDEVVWKEPPTPAGPRDKLLKQLQARPGAWGMVQAGEPNSSAVTVWKKLGVEAKSVKEDGAYNIYARWPAAKAAKEGVPVAVPRPSLPTPGGSPVNGGGYLASRAARGVPADGVRPPGPPNPPTPPGHRPVG